MENVQCLEAALNTAAAYMASYARYEDTAIFVGTSKSGKSTLINYLIGNKLVGDKVYSYKPVILKKADNSIGPEIGIEAVSKTSIPSRYDSERICGLAIWDAPGFDDNRGVIQDITNAFYICEFFKNIKTTKIMLVVDFKDIVVDNIRATLTLLKTVQNLLKDKMRDTFSGIGIIFTKVPSILHDTTVDREFVNEILTYQLLSNDSIEISHVAKDLIKYLINNNKNIGFFKQATEGIVTDDIEDGIMRAISNVKPITEQILKQISPSIAEGSKVFLYEAREQLSSMQMFVELQELVGTTLQNKLVDVENKQGGEISRDELDTLMITLTCAKDRMVKSLDDTMSFDRKVESLKVIDPTIEHFINAYNLCKKAIFMVFVDKLLGMSESRNFDLYTQNILVAAVQKCDELLIWVKLKTGEIDKQEAEAELAKYREMYNSEINKLKNEIADIKKANANLKFQSPFISGGRGLCTIL